MRVVRNGDREVDRLVLELRTRHRQDDLMAMHREGRALNEDRRAQEIEFHVALRERQLALGQYTAGRREIAVDDNFAANRTADAEVGWINQQSQPYLRREVMQAQRQIMHRDALGEIHRAVERR